MKHFKVFQEETSCITAARQLALQVEMVPPGIQSEIGLQGFIEVGTRQQMDVDATA